MSGLRRLNREINDRLHPMAGRLPGGDGPEMSEGDRVNHPSHYNQHPSGVECVTIAEHFSFNLGMAIKYIWRSGVKGNEIEDLQKAAFCINREIERLQKMSKG